MLPGFAHQGAPHRPLGVKKILGKKILSPTAVLDRKQPYRDILYEKELRRCERYSQLNAGITEESF